MPWHVPGSPDGDGLLSLLAPCFSQPTFQTFRALVRGFIGLVGEHTITGMWQAARLAGRVHHSRGHDFFAYRRWEPDDLGLRLLDFLVTALVNPAATTPPHTVSARALTLDAPGDRRRAVTELAHRSVTARP